MSNTRKVRGAKRRPPFKQALPLNPSPAVLNAFLMGKSGLFVKQFEHELHCPTIKSHREQDCICTPDLRLMEYAPSKGGKR